MAFESGTYSWALQERLKGRLPIGMFLGSNYGGWGFNHEWDTIVPDPNNVELSLPVQISASDANLILFDQLRSRPFFEKGTNDSDLFTDVTLGANSIDYPRRSRLLAEAFPAMTLPAGGNLTKAFDPLTQNIDMQVKFQRTGIWPKVRDKDVSWRHSDAREVAYPFVFRLFENMADVIEKGVVK